MVEKRENVRVSPPEGSYVINQLSGKKIGRIIDVSVSGLLLAGRSENIKSGMIFQLEMVMPNANKNAHYKVGAECIWEDLQTSGLTFAGFQIIDISNEDNAALELMIQQLITD